MKKLNDTRLWISDWSGVMSDDRLPVYEANMRVVERHGIKRISFAEWLPRTQLGARELFAHMGLTEENGDMLFEEYRDALSAVRSEGIHPVVYADALFFMQAIGARGGEIIVVSTHPKDHLMKEAQEYGLFPHVSQFIGDSKDKVPAIEEILSVKDIAHSAVAYMGDTIYDIHAAKAVGVTSVAVATGYHTKERLLAEQPNVLAGSLSELLVLV